MLIQLAVGVTQVRSDCYPCLVWKYCYSDRD
jgi:hypothetical protein